MRLPSEPKLEYDLHKKLRVHLQVYIDYQLRMVFGSSAHLLEARYFSAVADRVDAVCVLLENRRQR